MLANLYAFVHSQQVVFNHDAVDTNEEENVKSGSGKDKGGMIYTVNESPPLYLSIFFGLQVN